jgi:hypothetical protein
VHVVNEKIRPRKILGVVRRPKIVVVEVVVVYALVGLLVDSYRHIRGWIGMVMEHIKIVLTRFGFVDNPCSD